MWSHGCCSTRCGVRWVPAHRVAPGGGLLEAHWLGNMGPLTLRRAKMRRSASLLVRRHVVHDMFGAVEAAELAAARGGPTCSWRRRCPRGPSRPVCQAPGAPHRHSQAGSVPPGGARRLVVRRALAQGRAILSGPSLARDIAPAGRGRLVVRAMAAPCRADASALRCR